MNSHEQFIEFQEKIGILKHLRRTGWILRDVPMAETVASHSWRMAVMALQKEKELTAMGADVQKVIEMALLHDVGEAVIGDIVPEKYQPDGKKVSDKEKKETEANVINQLTTDYSFPKLKKLFNEYESADSLEAQIVKNLDKLDMILQAYEYKTQYPHLHRLDEFIENNADCITLPVFQMELEEIKARQFKDI